MVCFIGINIRNGEAHTNLAKFSRTRISTFISGNLDVFHSCHAIANQLCWGLTDSKGNPRCITNSKGKKRRVGSKDLQQAVKTCDANFLDFIRRCLE